MYYLEVYPSSLSYHGDGPLTYSHDSPLPLGQVVEIQMQRAVTLGVVGNTVKKPAFKTKLLLTVHQKLQVPPELVELLTWLGSYYPAPLGQLVNLMLPNTLKQSHPPVIVSSKPLTTVKLPPLTAEQQKTLTDIHTSAQSIHLLHGDTGSGKTRIYLELIKPVLKSGKSILLLTPEIGLTPQLAATIETAFPGKVTVLHSALSAAKRRDAWISLATATEPRIVVGPRSALFAPLSKIGIIILDEAHDTAYKQEQSPYYVTSRVAAKLTNLHTDAKLIMGSATPSIADYYVFKQKNLPIHRITSLALANKHDAQTKVIDLKQRSKFSKSSWLSDDMLAAIDLSIAKKEQSIVFLNRRGSARIVLCAKCGWQAECPRCDIALTYHNDTHLLRCHTCGHQEHAPATCQKCSAADLIYKSAGTKAIADELIRLYPRAHIVRFDGDNKKSESLETRYHEIQAGDADIIVGTQLLAKGHDLPKLGMVGIVSADSGLSFPDFSAEERTYQLINQVAGRVNRGHRDTKLILQTYHPESQLLAWALEKNFEAFYEQQILERKTYGFPPFKYLLVVRAERATRQSAEKAIHTVVNQIRATIPGIEVSAPTPAFVERVNGKYRWQTIIKSSDRSRLIKVIRQLPANTRYDIDPANLL